MQSPNANATKTVHRPAKQFTNGPRRHSSTYLPTAKSFRFCAARSRAPARLATLRARIRRRPSCAGPAYPPSREAASCATSGACARCGSRPPGRQSIPQGGRRAGGVTRRCGPSSDLAGRQLPASIFRRRKGYGGGARTLHKGRQHLAPGLQQRVAHDDAQELFQPGPPALDDVVAEAVGKDLAGQRRDRHARRLALQHVAEVLKVRVAAVHRRRPQLEGRDVGPAHNLVVGIHVPSDAVRSRITDLFAVCRQPLVPPRRSVAPTGRVITSISRKFSGGP